jgi:2-polyprenyl-6-methoxyphenol hydroxylase-like FAD-dependent oxidoreductase
MGDIARAARHGVAKRDRARVLSSFMGTAAIIGGSIAGVLAARVLSECFERVVVFERDELCETTGLRKGVPQAHHVHALLAAGAASLEELLPGLFDAVARRGGHRVDMSSGNNWFHFGVWKRRLQMGIEVHLQSRALLEQEIRRLVLARAGVELKRAAVELVEWQGGKPSVVHDGTRTEFDFLVDASGRGSKLPQFLERAGLTPPRTERVGVDVTYTSARYAARAKRDWGAILIYPNPPSERAAGAVLPIENGETMVSLFAWGAGGAGDGDAEFLEFASRLPSSEIADFLRDAERMSDFHRFQYREARLHHYASLRSMPPRTIVLGDALCSVDPVFGQGMAVTALSGKILRDCVQESGGDPDRIASLFLRRCPAAYRTAWQLSTSEDFRYPEVKGQRPFGLGFVHWYTGQVHRLTSVDAEVLRQFGRVMHLLDAPTSLFRPSILGKVLRAGLSSPERVTKRPTTST